MGGQQQAFDLQDLAALVDRYALLVVAAESAFGVLPGTEAVYCDSVDEAIVWLEGSRAWSAVVAGRSHPALEEAAARRGVPVATLPAVDLPAFLRDRASPIRSAHDLGRCGAALGAMCPVAPAGRLGARLERGDAGALLGPKAGAERATVGGRPAPVGSGPAPVGSGGGDRAGAAGAQARQRGPRAHDTQPDSRDSSGGAERRGRRPAGNRRRPGRADAGRHAAGSAARWDDSPGQRDESGTDSRPMRAGRGNADEVGRTWQVPDEATPIRGALVAVCGPGGTGASTVAMAVAAGLARRCSGIVLADLALRAGQAVLHQVAATEAGLEALVHAHRVGRPTPEEVHVQTLPLDGPITC